MEFSSELSAFQGVLISADNVHSFNKLTAKGGNEEKIAYVIHSVRNFFMLQKYIDEKGIVHKEKIRQFAFYIILNADLPVLQELVDIEELAVIIWTLPTIANCLMCEMLWQLNMGEYVDEVIAFSYPQLALELTDALLYSIKYFSPRECLRPLEILSAACYKFICRLDFFNVNAKQIQFAFNCFQKCVKYLTEPPNYNLLDRLKRDEVYKYLGKCLHTMLCTINKCFNEYSNTQTFQPGGYLKIYTHTYKDGCISHKNDYKISECTNNLLIDTLNNCHIELLDKCKELVMSISVDIFCAWREFEENGISMQQTIGELSYSVHKTLLNSNLSEHSLIAMLEQISCKPANVNEVINTMDIAAITKNIMKNNNDSMKWVQALIYRDTLCVDADILHLIDSHLELLNEEDCQVLFKKLYYNADNCTETKGLVQLLRLKAYQHCDEETKTDIIEDHFKDGFFNNDMEAPQFNHMLIEIFNKLAVTPEPDLSYIFGVFIQNPKQVYYKIFNFALENQHQTHIMLKVMSFLGEFTDHVYKEETEPCLILTLKSVLELQINNDAKLTTFIHFVSSLKEMDIISGTKLLFFIIMPGLHKAIVDLCQKMMHIHIKLLSKGFSATELLEYRAPMLAMLAQVMERLRWKIDTYHASAYTTLGITIKLQHTLMSTHMHMPDYEIYWLKNKIKGIDPMNMYYFRQLWNPPGNTYLDIISGIQIKNDLDSEQLSKWLAQVFCSCTAREWKMVWECLFDVFGKNQTLDLCHKAMLLLLIAEKAHRTETTWKCFLNCYRNFIQAIRYKFLKVPLQDNEVSSVINKLLKTASYISDNKIPEFGAAIVPLLAFIVERKQDYSQNIWERMKSQLLKHEILVNTVSPLFSSGASNEISKDIKV